MYVVLNPFESEPLVVQARVRSSIDCIKRLAGEPSKGAETVVGGDEDDAIRAVVRALLNDTGRVTSIERIGLVPKDETTTMKPSHVAS